MSRRTYRLKLGRGIEAFQNTAIRDARAWEMRPQSSNVKQCQASISSRVSVDLFCEFVLQNLKLLPAITTQISATAKLVIVPNRNWMVLTTTLTSLQVSIRPPPTNAVFSLGASLNWGPWGHGFRGTFLSDTHSQSNPQQKIPEGKTSRNYISDYFLLLSDRKHPVL